MALDVINGQLDGADFFRFLVWNLGLEFLFECHHQFHSVELIRAKVGDE